MSNLLNLSPADFCEATKACAEGRDWAVTQLTMSDVWENCPNAEWLLWIANKIGQRPDDRTLRLFAVWCARNTPLSDGRVTGDLITDPRSLAALEVAERYAEGRATDEELAAAWAAAWAAAGDAAGDAAGAAAGAAAGDAAWAAGWAAGWAPWDAAWAARDAARPAARAAAADAQADHLRTLVPNPFKKEGKQ